MSRIRNIYTAKNGDGNEIPLRFVKWENGVAYMTTDGAAAYLVNPDTGIASGIDSQAGIMLELVPNAKKRLRAGYRAYVETQPERDAKDAERDAAIARFDALVARGEALAGEKRERLSDLVCAVLEYGSMDAALGLVAEALEPYERLADQVRIAATTKPPSWYQNEAGILAALKEIPT